MNPGKLGIDLGTTFSCCGVYKSNRVELLAFKTGNRTTPSRVYYNPKTPEIVVGSAAKDNISAIGHVVYDSKRFIGRKFRDPKIQEDMTHWPFKVVEGRNGEPLVELEYNNKTVHLTANDVSTEILKKIKEEADEYLGQNPKLPTEEVVTVPAYFNNQQRQNTIEAAKNANLKVIKIINEPTAAAIAYAYQRIQQRSAGSDEENLMIYDFGGGTFDVSIIKINFKTKKITVLATGGNSHLGGEDIDQRLVEYYSQKYKEKTGNSVTLKQQFQLKKACDEAKCLLSTINIEDVSVNWNKLEDEEVDNTLTLTAFNKINKDLFEKTITIVEDVIDDSGLKKEEINYVVLVGGSSRIKEVQGLLEGIFPKKTVICKDTNADEVVAYGACLYANLDYMHFEVQDIISHTLSTDVEKDGKTVLHTLIPRNTQIPYESKETISFANFEAKADHIDISVYEGEGEYPTDPGIKQLDSVPFIIPISNVEARSYIIDTRYKVDDNGILTIHVRDRQNNKEQDLMISLK